MRILFAPLIGAVIGYITNALAIKMLFRPRKAIYIGKWHVPFTPGLIPQQKDRIAASIGKVISTQLLNPETIRQTVLSEHTLSEIEGKVTDTLEQYREDPRTVHMFLEIYIEPSRIEEGKIFIKEQGTSFLMEKLQQEDIGRKVVQYGMDALREKMGGQALLFGGFLNDVVFKSIEDALSGVVNDAISEKAPEIIHEQIGEIEEDLLGKTLGEIYESKQQYIPSAAAKAAELYKMVVENNLEKVLEVIDVEDIVAQKVRSFDAEQLEQMIFGIMKRELNAIVYLGALLGALMGFINLLF